MGENTESYTGGSGDATYCTETMDVSRGKSQDRQ